MSEGTRAEREERNEERFGADSPEPRIDYEAGLLHELGGKG